VQYVSAFAEGQLHSNIPPFDDVTPAIFGHEFNFTKVLKEVEIWDAVEEV
jgi:hypothetical protein